MQEAIENGVRNLCGASKTVTISFWARSSIANKKLGVYLYQYYGTGGSPTSGEVINGTNWTLTSSWTKYTYTFTTNTLVGKTFGTNNDDYLQVSLTYMWGSTYPTRVGAAGAETYVGSGNIDIAQVQLCAGDVALPFQPKSFNQELLDCQRYYEKSYDYTTTLGTGSTVDGAVYFNGYTATSSQKIVPGFYKVMKRAKTTPSYWDYAGNASKISTFDGAGVRTDNVAADGLSMSSQTQFSIYKTGVQTGMLAHWAVEAEL